MTLLHHDVKAWFDPETAVAPEAREMVEGFRAQGMLLLKVMPQGIELEQAMLSLRQSLMWATAAPATPCTPLRRKPGLD